MRYPVAIVVAAASLSAAFVNLAAAADIPSQPAPYRAPVAVPVPAFSWTGFYIGAHGGGGWATDKVTNVTGTAEFPAGFVNAANKPSGVLAGGYAGFNYQLSQWLVVGLDGDGSWTNISGNSTDPSLAVAGATANTVTRINWLATASGRVGIAVDNWLFFAKGGGAFAEFETNTAVLNAAGVTTSNITSSDTRIGWMAGAGIEWAFTPNWLVKAEYNYIDFKATNYNATSTPVAPPNTPAPLTRNATTILNVAKAGVAYKF
jgi:outer membrane immunogenic protein